MIPRSLSGKVCVPRKEGELYEMCVLLFVCEYVCQCILVWEGMCECQFTCVVL